MRFNFKRLSNASCIRFARIVACEFCSSNRMTAARLFSPSFLFARHPIARPDQVSLLTIGMRRLKRVFFMMWRLRCAHRFSPFRFIYCSESTPLSQVKQKYRGNLFLDGVFWIARPIVEAAQIKVEMLVTFGFEQIARLFGMATDLTIHDDGTFFGEGVAATFL